MAEHRRSDTEGEPSLPEAVQRERAAEETAERDDSLAATERRGRVADADRDTSLPGTERRERDEAERADAEEAQEDPRPIPGEEHRKRD
ncbi:hypothetical protein PHK61_11350 [Actinomycetospora lutea]|uniref:hypothetical protein n=1 Tax=Actinomycetospora lutea TaxID=663604 RepID=UPI0023660378|nr:hypothetical protein [Actinomycetospora lutea]MDD7939010.1 hypothetical protein [Actinomycetospora lutea]